METFTIRNLTFSYPDQKKPTLSDLTLHVNHGEFIVLCGPSGCGKSTLLRQLKTVLAPHGVREGEILFEGQPLDSLDHRTQSHRIGFVQQSPDNQVVTDKVWHELAFGLESLGVDTVTIRRRVAEMASFFGMESWFHKNVEELSGGQKQLLNLAAVMVMHPSVLILDEPTSMLDPIAASDFLATLGKINREMGITVILTEHRLEETFPLATSVVVMDKGRLLCQGTPEEVGSTLKDAGHAMFLAMPTAMRIWSAVDNSLACPVTVREGRDWLETYAKTNTLKPVLPARQFASAKAPVVIQGEELWFRYEKEGADIVKGLSIEVHKGEFLALMGGNGTGKTTSLKLLSGLLKPYRGEVAMEGSVGVLPQNPQTLFVKKTVREDLMEILREEKTDKEEKLARVGRVVSLCRLEELLERHPYDLSGGEQQRAALAKVLLLSPDILLMDEPTKGLDAEFKQVFAEIMQRLLKSGVTILMVSHDIEFCAKYAHRCALFFDGNVVTMGVPRDFFCGNNFYTTAANRMGRGVLPEAVTPEDVVLSCGGHVEEEPELTEAELLPKAEESPVYGTTLKKLPLWRKVLAGVSMAGMLALLVQVLSVTDLSALIGPDGVTALAGKQLAIYGALVLCLVVFILSISRKQEKPPIQMASAQRKLNRRTVVAAGLILLLIPLTLFVGEAYLGGRKYTFISLLILMEVMLPFFLVFESRKPQARELVVIAVLCAIGIAGRAAFFWLPNFKPVLALTIIAGVAFGGETGFLVGAMTMLVSNIMFSQGPWAPWQMFSMGIIGFLAGVLFRKGLLRRSRGALSAFGALCAILIYGGIMNASAALMWSMEEINWGVLLTYYISGFPMDCIHAVATWFFLWLAAEPMLEKMDRIKVKYGLVE